MFAPSNFSSDALLSVVDQLKVYLSPSQLSSLPIREASEVLLESTCLLASLLLKRFFFISKFLKFVQAGDRSVNIAVVAYVPQARIGYCCTCIYALLA